MTRAFTVLPSFRNAPRRCGRVDSDRKQREQDVAEREARLHFGYAARTLSAGVYFFADAISADAGNDAAWTQAAPTPAFAPAVHPAQASTSALKNSVTS